MYFITRENDYFPRPIQDPIQDHTVLSRLFSLLIWDSSSIFAFHCCGCVCVCGLLCRIFLKLCLSDAVSESRVMHFVRTSSTGRTLCVLSKPPQGAHSASFAPLLTMLLTSVTWLRWCLPGLFTIQLLLCFFLCDEYLSCGKIFWNCENGLFLMIEVSPTNSAFLDNCCMKPVTVVETSITMVVARW